MSETANELLLNGNAQLSRTPNELLLKGNGKSVSDSYRTGTHRVRMCLSNSHSHSLWVLKPEVGLESKVRTHLNSYLTPSCKSGIKYQSTTKELLCYCYGAAKVDSLLTPILL